MDKIKKNFGFGCLRLPMKDGEVDKEQMCKMVDTFLEQGFNYFDTAHGYLDGKSELALCDCLTSRHERSEYILTNKLTNFYFKSEEEIRPFFESQLKACGVDYFDFYLMHAQSEEIFKYFKKCHAYEIALQLKEEGKIRHTINGNPYQPVVFTEELAPFVCKQGSIRLDTIVNRTSAGVFLLQLHRLFIKRKRTHQRFSTVPGKKHLRHGLRVDILVDKLFQ